MLAALVTPIALIMSACGVGADIPGEGTTIEFLAPIYRDGAGGTKAQWDSIIADFEKSSPYTVHLQMEPWTRIKDVLHTDLQNPKTTPDVVNLDVYAAFARDGLLYQARDVLSDNVVKEFQPAFANNASLDGRQYGLPLFASTRTLFYNKDLFARAGLNAPPKTWADLIVDAKKITALGGGIYGYGMPLGSEETQAETSIWTFGARGQWSNGSAITINTPANLDGLSEIQKVVQAGVTQPNPGTTNRQDVIDAFIQGKIGMIEGLPPTIGDITKKNPDLHYATAPTPTKTGSPVCLGVADHLMAFVKDGRRRAAISAFLNYFFSPAVYAKFVKAEGFIPVTAAGADTLAHEPVTLAFGSTLANAKFYPINNPGWVAAQAALEQRVGSLATGASPADVAAQVQSAVDSGK